MEITAYLYVPFAAWAIAQIIKFSLSLVRGETDLRYLYASGGMPSVHSAVVCSLATWALIAGGASSPLFGVTAVFAAIVMYDSFGVRRSTGEQARTLNRLIGDLATTGGLKNAQDYDGVREILGHKPLEVLVGAGLGIFIASIFGYQKLVVMFPTLFAMPSSTEAKAIMIVAAILIVSMAPLYWIAHKKYKKNPKAKSALTYVALISAIAGLFLAGCGLVAYEGLNSAFAQWYVILLVVLVWWVAIVVFLVRFWQNRHTNKPSNAEERKAQWLKQAKTKTKKKKK